MYHKRTQINIMNVLIVQVEEITWSYIVTGFWCFFLRRFWFFFLLGLFKSSSTFLKTSWNPPSLWLAPVSMFFLLFCLFLFGWQNIILLPIVSFQLISFLFLFLVFFESIPFLQVKPLSALFFILLLIFGFARWSLLLLFFASIFLFSTARFLVGGIWFPAFKACYEKSIRPVLHRTES